MDFFGNFTNSQIIAYITAGVTATGENIWPLFAAVGIIIAFIIAAFVIDFIKHSVGKRRRTSGGGYETDQYTAEQSAAIVAKIREIERRPGAGYP